jgi:hypothetical protein
MLLDTAGAPTDKLALQEIRIPSVVCALVRGGYSEQRNDTCPCSVRCGGEIHVDLVRRATHEDNEVYHTHRMPLTRCQTATPKTQDGEISDERAFALLETASILKATGGGGGGDPQGDQKFQSLLNRELIPWWIKHTPGTHHRFNFDNTNTFLDFMVFFSLSLSTFFERSFWCRHFLVSLSPHPFLLFQSLTLEFKIRTKGFLGMGLFTKSEGPNAIKHVLRYTVAQIGYQGLDKTIDSKILAEFLFFTSLHYFLVANGRFLVRTDRTQAPTEARYTFLRGQKGG